VIKLNYTTVLSAESEACETRIYNSVCGRGWIQRRLPRYTHTAGRAWRRTTRGTLTRCSCFWWRRRCWWRSKTGCGWRPWQGRAPASGCSTGGGANTNIKETVTDALRLCIFKATEIAGVNGERNSSDAARAAYASMPTHSKYVLVYASM
jgi:hypothetical protein